MDPQKRTVGQVLAGLGKAICYLFLFLLCQALISSVFALAASLMAMLDPGLGIDPMELVYACTDQISLFSAIATLVILIAFFLLRRKPPLREVGFLATRGRFVWTAAAITPLLYVAVSLVLSLLPAEWMEDYAEASAALDQTGVLMILATVVAAPLVEEIIFRGLVLSRLRRVMPGWLAVLLSALAFGVCHGQIVWICYAFVLGLIFGTMALRSRSIWPSFVAHVLFNGIGQLAVYLPETDTAALLFSVLLIGTGIVASLIVALFRIFHPIKTSR